MERCAHAPRIRCRRRERPGLVLQLPQVAAQQELWLRRHSVVVWAWLGCGFTAFTEAAAALGQLYYVGWLKTCCCGASVAPGALSCPRLAKCCMVRCG